MTNYEFLCYVFLQPSLQRKDSEHEEGVRDISIYIVYFLSALSG